MRSSDNKAKEDYINSVFAQEDEALKNIIDSLREDEVKMQISPGEGKILHTLVKMTGAKKIIELGVLAGYSSTWMARALPESGKLYAIELDYKKEKRIRDNFAKCNIEDKIDLRIGKAGDVLKNLESDGPFDMIFIDADKANYLNYLDWAEKHVKRGGLIVGDNTFLFGAVYGANSLGRDLNPDTVKIMQQFNKRLADPAKYTSMLLPTTEGMTIAVKGF